jgi:hypothetical protein
MHVHTPLLILCAAPEDAECFAVDVDEFHGRYFIICSLDVNTLLRPLRNVCTLRHGLILASYQGDKGRISHPRPAFLSINKSG